MMERSRNGTCLGVRLGQGRCIDPGSIAFDIDGVVADTMEVFVELAREEHGLEKLTKEDLYCYDLYRCVPAKSEVIDELICRTLDEDATGRIPPMPGAFDVLEKLAERVPLRFVTARVWPDSIVRWIREHLPGVPQDRIQVVATGDPEAKSTVLKDLNIRFFLEDRLETCRTLARHGLQPILYDQPWNRCSEEFPRVYHWKELEWWLGL